MPDRRRAILDYIKQFQAENGHPPTQRQIAEAVGLRSLGALDYHLKRMVAAREIRKGSYRSVRTIEVICSDQPLPQDGG